MPLRPWFHAALYCTVLAAQDPLAVPAEVTPWARRVTGTAQTQKAKLQNLLTAIFRPAEEGGLGLVYDNSRTRTIEEVWRDKRANCISLTAFYVAACRSIGIEAVYAEPVNTNRWRRVGPIIRLERHVVAMAHLPPLDDVVADFLPQLRRRAGVYVVNTLPEARIRALFHSNRAVELLEEGRGEDALAEAAVALKEDAQSASVWNIQGVVQRSMGQVDLAEASYRRAHALDPKDGSVVGNLETLLKETDRAEEAGRFRVLGTELRKKDPYFNAFLAEEALGEGRLEEALERIQTAIKLLPYDPEFHLTEARIRMGQGQPEGARKALQTARRWALPSERERYDSKLAGLAKL